MDETAPNSGSWRRTWLKRFGVVFGVSLMLLVLFHRPLLQTVVRRVAIHFAASENLKLDLRVEGSILGGIVLRNVHAVATGPSAVQVLDADRLAVDYSLWSLMTGGLPKLLQSMELRDASIVLDPAKAPPKKKVVEEKITLPAFFPDQLTLSNVNLRIKSEPQDLVVEHLYLDLNPRQAGELRIAKLQLANGRSWQAVTAKTSYQNKNLFLRDLVLDDQTRFSVVNLDASKIDSKKLDVAVVGIFAGAKINSTISLREAGASLGTDINFAVEDTSLEAVTKYLQPPELEEGRIKPPEIDPTRPKPQTMAGRVKRFAVAGSGQLDKPNSWNGLVTGEIDDLAAGGVVFDSVIIDANAADGRATIKNIELARGDNRITVQGSADLPARTEEFGRVPATFQIRGNVPELRSLTAGMAQPISGPAELNGQISVRDATITADLAAVAGPVDFGRGTVQRLVVRLRAVKKMPPPMPDEEDVGRETIPPPYYSDLTSNIGLEVTGLQFGDYALDSIGADVHTTGKDLVVDQAVVARKDNRITARAQYELPLDFDRAATQPGWVEFSVVAPQVGDFWIATAPNQVTGSLELNARTDLGPQLGNGYFDLYGANLAAHDLTIPEVSAQGGIAENIVYLNDLTAQLNQHDHIRAHGVTGLDAPHRYSGSLEMDVANLATFEPILNAAGKGTKLGGSLAINWQGSGVATKFENSGVLKLKVEHGRYGDMQKLEANIDANYSPEALNVPIIFFSSDKVMFQAVMQTRDEKLEISKIEIDQGQAKYAGGYVSIPFVWKNIGTDKAIFPADGETLVSIQSENLDIAKLAKDFGTAAPVSGLANVKLDAHGPLSDLHAAFDLQLTGLRSQKLEEFKPAAFVIGARLENNQLVVKGKLEQAQIEPVQIDANLPLNLAKIIEAKQLDDQTPVSAKVRMPRSSVNFVRQFVPALERVDGSAALDVNVGGTIARPVFSGAADMTINVARFSNPTLPALTNFTARLAFSDDTLNFQQFRGDVAGGPFNVTGRITFPKLTEPTFDLQLKADSVLVARNDDLTARVDANISVTGPLAGATVRGNVAITNSQFLKNLDLIPIGLPGRPAPAPEPPSAKPDLSFPEPPLRDWKFDVAIKTKDPFLIRGNLANGGALVDMKLSGTGLHPQIDGSVRLQNVEATLPFSRLEISQGFLYFNPEDPLNPTLDLQGTSLIRDYTVRVYVYGTADAPEAVFTSEPPLPQEEIITLLATGTTREELLNGNNVLAGRAVMLLGQQLYTKIFKKGQPTKSNSVFDKLQVDIGNVDPRTGQQTATARYRVNEKVQLIGDLGVQGDFRGTVKYLIRFH